VMVSVIREVLAVLDRSFGIERPVAARPPKCASRDVMRIYTREIACRGWGEMSESRRDGHPALSGPSHRGDAPDKSPTLPHLRDLPADSSGEGPFG
jgi:hypothetical protein